MERATGIEPASSAWEADILPMNYARMNFGATYSITYARRKRKTYFAAYENFLERAITAARRFAGQAFERLQGWQKFGKMFGTTAKLYPFAKLCRESLAKPLALRQNYIHLPNHPDPIQPNPNHPAPF